MSSATITTAKPFGALAEFGNPAELYHACEKVRDEGFSVWDAHTPFPVHGLEDAMGAPRSKVPWISLVFALFGGTIPAFALQSWVAVEGSRQVISGKPMLSWQAFIPVTFEVSVLLGAVGALLGMLMINRLPQLYHSLFRSERFERFSDDKFFISIESRDPKFDAEGTVAFLQSLGSSHVELVED
ncbi:MAG: DUF3341 domain-containing protein [Deltaproteobacteria bacterium]|nr:DUF3341 domain-containing protein [Deltaproteobacteria bacterium]